MGKLKAQVSPDYAVSAFIFSVVVLFIFFSLTRTYYSRTWEMKRAEANLEAMKLAYFFVGEEGNWSSNPLESTSLGLKGEEGINETKLRWLVGMPYPHVVNKTGIEGDFKIEVKKLPSISITSDIKEMYIGEGEKANFTVSFETSKNCTLYIVIVGGNVTYEGDYATSLHFQSLGIYHNLRLELYPGIYVVKALAVGDGYGAYETTFRVI